MTQPMQALDWEECLVPERRDPEIERAYRERMGVVPHAAYYMSAVPWVNRALLELNSERGLLVDVDYGLNQLLWLAVSQDNSCRYCFAAHRAFLRTQGFPERRIQRMEQTFFAAELDPRERVAIEFARRVSRSNPLVAPEDVEPLLRAGFSVEAAKEIACVTGAVVFANRTATLPALPPIAVERQPDTVLARLLKPLHARRMRALRTPGRREPLAPAMRSGPFQYLVDALEPLPLAGVLWRMLDGAFAAPGLSPRARALVFAVVARGLGCDVCEREALRLVAAEGFPAAEVEPALAHLAAPAFDPVEQVIVPFTRETIRYSEPAPLQRRARAVLAQVGPAAFGEFVGTAALANMLARLSFLAQLA